MKEQQDPVPDPRQFVALGLPWTPIGDGLFVDLGVDPNDGARIARLVINLKVK